MSMAGFQIWLVSTLKHINPVYEFMNSKWGWPTAESVHFLGLSLLVGCIGLFDLRLLGLGKRIPIAALHRLIPWGLTGYAINLVSGAAFLMTEPNQYIYNPSFHFKILFMAVAGFNATAFYLTAYRPATAPDAAADAPRSAKIVATISLCMWIGVIVCGRLLTFYRPGNCGPEGPGFIATCIPRSR
jgi:hypothetical protein